MSGLLKCLINFLLANLQGYLVFTHHSRQWKSFHWSFAWPLCQRCQVPVTVQHLHVDYSLVSYCWQQAFHSFTLKVITLSCWISLVSPLCLLSSILCTLWFVAEWFFAPHLILHNYFLCSFRDFSFTIYCAWFYFYQVPLVLLLVPTLLLLWLGSDRSHFSFMDNNLLVVSAVIQYFFYRITVWVEFVANCTFCSLPRIHTCQGIQYCIYIVLSEVVGSENYSWWWDKSSSQYKQYRGWK